jgi:dTDP-4-amino-4,6-dideoxygalactose transaminase
VIQLFRPTLGEEEVAAVSAVFESGWIGRGPGTEEFEQRFAAHLGVGGEHVKSIGSCTEALFLALELLELGSGDEVVIPTISFVGAANAIAARGARPVFCDVDRRTLNARIEDIEAKLTKRTKAVLPLHYGGFPGEIAAIAELCRDRGVALVEDAACAVSSRSGDRACGTFGDLGTWSFDAMKILVTGDAGMLYVRNPELAERAEKMIYLGLESESGFSAAGRHERWWEFEISSFSRRATINDMVSAIGLVQLGKLPGFVERRREVHERYDAELAELGWLKTPPPLPDGQSSSYYFYWLQLREEGARDRLAAHLRDRGVYTTFRYHPLHLVALYDSMAGLPSAERAANETLCIPIHQALSDDDVAKVVGAVQAFEPVGAPA